jgi:glycosyltransferase involved in cell wall biosynthesis
MLDRLKKISRMLRRDHVYDLIIYDDIYPHPGSGFRMEEFTRLLEEFPGSKILLSAAAYSFLNIPVAHHAQHMKELLAGHPSLAGRVEKTAGKMNINCRLFYCVFLNNIIHNLDWIEANDIPFAFTLYPGGGFNPGTAATEESLKRIFTSRNFRKVVVTQKRTYDYLVDNGFCSAADILFVFGVVVPQLSLTDDLPPKQFYGKDKSTFDICFCAAKYTKYGEDKGYPLFVDFMTAIALKYPFVQFHVIGGFDKDVLPVAHLGEKVRFHGYQDFDRLKRLFRDIDMIISPNQPDKLAKGAFDGFPLGTVIEAALNEVVVMLTDPLKENIYFADGTELLIILPLLQDMLDKFDWLMRDTDRAYAIAKKGRLKFKHIYSNDYQMRPRLQLLQTLIT